MFPVLAAAFFAVPLGELAVIILVGQQLGVAETLLLLVAVSLVGAWMAKQQGLGVLARIRAELDAGRVPGRELADGALVLAAALMLLTPGFITDALALLLLLPPVRVGVRGGLRSWFERRIDIRMYGPRP